MNNKKGYIDGEIIIVTMIVGIVVLLIAFSIVGFFGGLALDFASGNHRITPTAVDTDMWGNYKVYYRTSQYTQNQNEDYYYIDKNNAELAEQMKEYVSKGKEVVVYYDKYVGFKGFTAPSSSPIIKIEVID